MGWDAVVFGELTFPKGGIAAWKALVIEPGLYEDTVWKSAGMMGDPSERTTVADMLAKLEGWWGKASRRLDHLFVDIDGDRVSLRGCLNEDDFRCNAGDIATMLRVSEKVGASGEYVVVANDDMVGERLLLGGKRSRCEAVDLTESFTGGDGPESELDYAVIIEEILRTVSERVETLSKKKTAKPKAAKPKAAKKATTSPVSAKKPKTR